MKKLCVIEEILALLLEVLADGAFLHVSEKVVLADKVATFWGANVFQNSF